MPLLSLRLGVLALTIVSGLVPLGLRAQSAGPVAVVASGLTNPRGFALDEDGSIVVASAGQSGATAGVVRIGEDGCPVPIAAGLPSYRVAFGGPVGVADVAFRDGALYALVAGGNIDADGMRNGLYQVEEGGALTLIADISAFIRDNPVAERPRDYDTDGQPYAMVAMGDAFWATEGNSNQLLRLGLDGSVSRIADLSAGHPIPTGIAPAPDDGAYVGLFTAAPYRKGAASAREVAADGAVREVWSGLTLVTALAVGPDGALYALEMATGIDPDDPASIGPGSGRVVRQTGPKTSEAVVTGLDLPAAMAVGPDGALYALEMATGIDPDDPASIGPGSGRVVRQTGPETAEEVVTGLNLPVAMAFGPDGALYIAGPAFGGDDGAGTILRVDVSGSAPVAIPESLPTPTPCS